MNTMEIETLENRLEEVKGKLGRTISQIALVETKYRDLNQRYKRACTNKKNSFRYNLRMRMSITAGVRLMYMQYLTTKAEEVRVMEQTLKMLRTQQQPANQPNLPAAAPVPNDATPLQYQIS